MSTSALNSTYKYAIMALEASYLTSDASAAATTLAITGNYITQTPFVVGRVYTIMDNSGSTTPNSEKIMVTDVSGLTAVAKTGVNMGYTVSGNLGVVGFAGGSLGYSGGINNGYATASNAKILTPGVMAAVTTADFNCRFKTITDNPKVDFDDESSRYASGDEGRDQSIPGMSSAEISWTQKLSWGGSVTAYPTWTKIMESTGHVIRKYTTKGFGFLPHPVANTITATIWVISTDTAADISSSATTVYRYAGAHGGNGCSIGCSKIGDVYMMNMKMQAKFVDTVLAPISQLMTLTSPDTQTPEVFLSNTCSVPSAMGLGINAGAYANVAALLGVFALSVGSVFYITTSSDTTDTALATAKGSALELGDSFIVGADSTVTYNGRTKNLEISSWNLDFGGTVNPKYDQLDSTGISYYSTTDRDPSITINPYMLNKNSDDIWAAVNNKMTGVLRITAPNNHLTVVVCRAQLMSPTIANREGLLNTNRKYRCLRNNTGSGSSYSSAPEWAMYEILIGTKS